MKKNNQNRDSVSAVSFENTAVAFRHKSDRELLLSYLIFGLTKSPFLVKFLSQAAKFTLAIGLPVKPFITAIGSFDLFKKVTANEPLYKKDQRELNKVKIRLGKICDASCLADKPVYIDAEETWIQGAIDRLAEEMMAKYNQNKAIVFTTLQLYRWDRNDYFKQLIEQARSGAYKLGIKIVRGAYLEKERERARRLSYKSPINESKVETDREYDKAVEIFIDNIDVVEICVGTHNEESCKLLIRAMAEKKLPNNHPHIYFSQLYGMSDNISFNLANAGYNVSKYLPFGPVESTLPYLARRAEENTAIAGQMSKELEIIVNERRRRKSIR